VGEYLTNVRHLKPGQWFEHVEYGIDMKSDDGSLSPDSAIVRASTVSLIDHQPYNILINLSSGDFSSNKR